MKKVCVVCGFPVESDVKECPNCGSYKFTTELQETEIRLRRLK